MSDYRLYRLHPLSGRFVGVEEIQAEDDESAIELSQQLIEGDAVELWCGGRKVMQITASDAANALVWSAESPTFH